MPMEHKEVVQLLTEDWEADRGNREDAMDDLRFLALDQWTEQERQSREMDGRPVLTVDQLNKFVNQVSGDMRQARPSVEVYPTEDADGGIAEIFEGLIRQIEFKSRAQTAYSHGGESAVRCGIGHWRIETVETTDSVFEQDIRISRVLDPLSVVWDASSQDVSRADASHVHVTDFISKTAYKKRFGDVRAPSDVDIDGGVDASLHWRRDDFHRISEYWYTVPKKRTLVLTTQGQTFDLEGFAPEEIEFARFNGLFVREREVEVPSIMRRLMDGHDWLDDGAEWAGQYLPIIPCLGPEIAYDGRIIRKSLIRAAKDGQKLYNYWRSAGAEAIAKSPSAPWVVTLGMTQGLEGYWNNANRSNMPFLPYNPDPDFPGLSPRRQDPPQVPAAMWQEAARAADDMKAATGIFDAALGARSNETSGRAILARQREGDIGSFAFLENFSAAIQRTGEILVDLIPRIYDTDRQVMVLGKDGSEAVAQINRKVISPDGVPIMINDLSHGRFNVRVQMGSSYTTARVEAREQMVQAMQANPSLWGVIGDLFFANSDYPGAEEIAQRLRRAVPPQLLEDQQQQPQEPNPVEAALAQLELATKQADIEATKAKAQKDRASAVKTAADVAGAAPAEAF